MLLHIYQFFASLKLAVVLILSSAFTFAVGTFVEARYGTPVAQFGVYQTWWFNLLVVLLAINIFCAAAIRYPWKRYQTGFVITHIGLLTLLLGTALSRMFGIDAQILVWENQSSGWALKDDAMHLSVTVHKDESATDAELRRLPSDLAEDDSLQRLPAIAFRPGPFSWKDYREEFHLWKQQRPQEGEAANRSFHPFHFISGKMFQVARLGKTSPGDVLYDKDGIKVEALEYYADSRQESAPMIELAVSMPRSDRIDANGKPVKSRRRWMRDQLSINKLSRPSDEFPHGASTAKARFAGGTVAFATTDDPRRLKAFESNDPEGELGEKGQVVLFIGGKPRRFNVDEKFEAGRFDIAGTKFQAEIAGYWPVGQLGFNEENQRYQVSPRHGVEGTVNPAVEILLYQGEAEEESARLVLFADQPNLAIHAHAAGIYGDYWFDHKEKDRNLRMQHGIGNRIDVLQVHKPDAEGDAAFQLHFRRWDKNAVVDGGKLAADGSPESALDAFSMADELKFYVADYIPAAQPEPVTLPVPFEKGKTLGTRRPAAKLRVTVDGNEEEFWLEAYKGDPDFSPRTESGHRIVAGKDRRVAITLPIDAVDIGFRVRLRDFDRRLDPGTSQPSHYSSTVDFLDRNFDYKIVTASFEGKRIEQVEFPLVLSHDSAFSAAAAQITADGKHVYWLTGDRRMIQRIELGNDEALPETIVGGAHVPIDPVAFEIDGENLFWAEYIRTRSGGQARIRRANLDGSDETTLAALQVKPTDLALDRATETIYFSYRNPPGRSEAGADDRPGGIGRVGYDGARQQDDILTKGYGVPSSIAVDPSAEKVYWTEPSGGFIRVAKFDGSGVRKLPIGTGQTPDSIAVDATAGRIYWTDLSEDEDIDIETDNPSDERHRIWTADLAGDDAEVFAGVRIDAPRSLMLTELGERLIWTQEATLKHNVWITMNAPVEYANPYNNQSYRIFQESFDGPYEEGTQEYHHFVPEGVDADAVYLSVLTVNYDPGRFIRNTGCLIVVLGITTMFYMRAYFFRRPDSPERTQRRTAGSRAENSNNQPSENGRQRSKEKSGEVIDAEVVT